MTSLSILEYAEKGSNYSKTISNMFVRYLEMGGKNVTMRGGGTHDFAEKYTPLVLKSSDGTK